jgi:hypothetical protein
VVILDPARPSPLAVQTWDWYEQFADGWLVWSIEVADGTYFHTLTEYGVLAKIGVNASGVGLHFNILHHAADGGPGAVCCHPELDAPGLGRWATLATVALDIGAGTLAVLPGGPCGDAPWQELAGEVGAAAV